MHISGNKVQEEKTLLNLFQIGEPDFFIEHITGKFNFTNFVFRAFINLNSNINTLFVLRQIALNIGDFKIKITKVEIV
jgi:hypothetical protein